MSIYTTSPPPEDHIATLAASSSPQPPIPQQPSYGLDSLVGLVSSLVLSPLYLYATLRGKSRVWDDLLDALPDDVFRAGPGLDVGCGRGLVLLKAAQRKKKLAAAAAATTTTTTNSNSSGAGGEAGQAVVPPAYGIDIFSTADQTGNAPLATYLNAASLSCVPHTVLHTASFAERFPFADGAFSLVTSNLALHNASREGRLVAVREIARVCRPGGTVLIVDLFGFFKDHRTVLEEELEWTDVDVSMVGVKMLYGALPCQVLRATKPMAQST
ncbi:methyltransferase [Purpureocillium lilacinum]|nr:methyltransferase [Purpureocillium lilacinum]OAQ77291.1 methyltransferase [Purpureocillium lilacinum]OAQ85697.1 methyltransferase [Purpureocillium lilacinum]